MSKNKQTKQTIYFHDELNDDFADNGIKTVKIKDDYRYINKSWLFRFNSFWLRYFFAIPVLTILMLFMYRPKIKNKQVLKQLKKKGYYIYSNHVIPLDPIIIPVKSNPGKACVIISSADTFSIHPIVTWLVKHFLAIPVPNDKSMFQNYVDALSWHINKRHRVLIFPEAHIWPWYNKIRKFKAGSFRYPVNDEAPIVTYTTTFKKREGNRKPKPIIYIDGPFYPDMSLPYRERVDDLANRAYEAMKYRSESVENYEYIHYEKKED